MAGNLQGFTFFYKLHSATTDGDAQSRAWHSFLIYQALLNQPLLIHGSLANIAWDNEAHEMTRDLKDRKFKIEIFIIALIVISILTTLSFFAAWGRDDGTLEANDGIILNFLADSFNFFRLPTHGLFWKSIAEDASLLFIPTLVINVIFWTIVAERLITIGTRLIKDRRMKSNIR